MKGIFHPADAQKHIKSVIVDAVKKYFSGFIDCGKDYQVYFTIDGMSFVFFHNIDLTKNGDFAPWFKKRLEAEGINVPYTFVKQL